MLNYLLFISDIFILGLKIIHFFGSIDTDTTGYDFIINTVKYILSTTQCVYRILN